MRTALSAAEVEVEVEVPMSSLSLTQSNLSEADQHPKQAIL